MGLIGWLKRASRTAEAQNTRNAIDGWRREWAEAAAHPSAEQIQSLKERLDAFGLSEDEIDVEREMLDALEQVVALSASVAEHGLPHIETGHRIAAADVCHFTAPASMPDDPSQPSGRLLLTSARAAFAGGPASHTVPWHAITEVLRQERDLVLIRSDRKTMYRFRCNSYGDALCAAFVSARLARPRGQAARADRGDARRTRI